MLLHTEACFVTEAPCFSFWRVKFHCIPFNTRIVFIML
uniref:Uncharacterized protein n=1 Tax=Setaria italica TaxID=4555 RepID=K3XSV0_SETIT